MDGKRTVSNQRKPLNKCHSLKIAIAAETNSDMTGERLQKGASNTSQPLCSRQGPSCDPTQLGTKRTQRPCLYFPICGISLSQIFLRPASIKKHVAKKRGGKESFMMQLLNKGWDRKHFHWNKAGSKTKDDPGKKRVQEARVYFPPLATSSSVTSVTQKPSRNVRGINIPSFYHTCI